MNRVPAPRQYPVHSKSLMKSGALSHVSRIVAPSVLIPILIGCASSPVPDEIAKAPATGISVDEVQQHPERFRGHSIRWGGTIIAVHNRQETTEIEILSRPLDAGGEPRKMESGTGRFIARLAGFVDPDDYPEQRLVTITGRIEQVQVGQIGDYPYRYPVIAVEQSHLWPQAPAVQPPYHYPYPWGCHPWYGPWHRYPYWFY